MTVAKKVNIVFMISTLRVQVDFKSKENFGENFKSPWHGVWRGLLLKFDSMADDLAISDVARAFGLRTSAIRYYEQIGILPRPLRKNGQRRYERNVLLQLAVVQRAREVGFTLEEIRELFFGFQPGTAPPERWHKLSERKITELRQQMKRLKIMEALLKRMENCDCDALEECGERLLRGSSGEVASMKLRARHILGVFPFRSVC